MTMKRILRHRILPGVLAAILCSAPALAAPPPEVSLMLQGRVQAANAKAAKAKAAQVPSHARAGEVVAGHFNAASLRASRIKVELPNGRSLTASRLKETRGNRGEISWAGEFEGKPGSLLVVTTHRNRTTGFLHHDDEIWELTTGEDGITVLFAVNEGALPDEHAPIMVDADPDLSYSKAELEASAATGADPVVQDLLVVYTQKAVDRAGSTATLESRILNAVAAANAAYLNSDVGIRLNVVGMVRTNYVETGDMSVTLSRLRGTTDGYMDEVHSIRNQLGADLVAMISEDGGYCGIAYVMSSPSSGFASAAFSVTAQGCFSNQTFAHEIGHNQGNAHDRKNGGSSAYAYSFGYRTCDNIAPSNGQSFRTVMAYSCSGSRLNYFSNPRVNYNGAPMGVAYESDPANSADNARSMNNTAPITAAFRGAPSGPPPPGPTSLVGSVPAHDRILLSWRDNSANETGFVVQRAVNGSAFADRASLGTNTTSFADTGLTGGTTYSYRVRAWNSTGTSEFSNTITLVTPVPPPAPTTPAPANVKLATEVATVAWSDVNNESAYEVMRETRNPKNGRWTTTILPVGADVTSLMEMLSPGTYRYAVRALNNAGASQWTTAGCAECGSDGTFTVVGSGTKGSRKK
jgi:peptidyl-Asp metalloendopeptidase